MKQEIISYLHGHYDELFELNKYLYTNPEPSYKEFKSYDYITNFLSNHNFNIQKKFLDLETSFYASKGNGYPKICFLCEYDAVPEDGHITGHNLVATTSIAASLALGSVIDKVGGTSILIGCPGEYLGGTKSIMVKQGVFDDIDIVMMAHPDLTTCESGTSSAIIPLKINFIGNSGLSFLNNDVYTSLDAVLLTFNILNALLKGFPKGVEINSILSQGGYTPLILPLESEAKFYIRANDTEMATLAENKLREIVKDVSNLIHVKHTISLYEPPNEELLTNRTLNRLFSHNLKENGEITIGAPKNVRSGLSIGAVSRKVPCIHPYYRITEDSSIKYGSKDFANSTISKFAMDQCIKASAALASTAFDLIEKSDLLAEVKNEFFNTFK